MTWHRDPPDGWTWRPDPSVVLGSSYPARVDTSDPDPDYEPRPVGFTADLGTPKQATDTHPHVEAVAALDDELDARPALRCGLCGDVVPYHFRSCPSQQRRTE